MNKEQIISELESIKAVKVADLSKNVFEAEEHKNFAVDIEKYRKRNGKWHQGTVIVKAKHVQHAIEKAQEHIGAHQDGGKMTARLREGIEDRLAAARAKAAVKGKTKEKEDENPSVIRKIAGNSYGGSKQKEEKEAE